MIKVLEMERNIKLFRLYIFLYRLEMWLPVQILLLMDKGFSLSQVAILDAMWYLSTVVFEVPTGSITDRFGKKISFYIAAIFKALSLFLLVFGRSFVAVLIAEIVWGFSSSFETGTVDAFLYDSLKQSDREEDFRNVRGRITTLATLAAALGSVVAGYLAGIRIDLPILLTAIIAILVCPLIYRFKEPEVVVYKESSYRLHIRESARYIIRHREVGLLILYSAVMGAGIWAMHLFYQPLMRSYGVEVENIGILYLCFRLTAAAGAYFSDVIYRKLGKVVIYWIPLCFAIAVFALGIFVTPWILALIFVIFFINGLYFPVLRDLLNQRIPSGKRATIISAGAMFSCLISTTINPLLGRISDFFSLQTAFNVLGAGSLLSMSAILISMKGEAGVGWLADD
jgi:MFS family permease